MEKARAASIAGMACLAGLTPATVAANDTFGGAVAGPAPKVGRATLTPGGKARPPASAPRKVAAVIRAANAIAKKPYRYGGGHASWKARGYDYSGRSASPSTAAACCEARWHRPA